jgi:hypothetical protein
MSFKNKKYFVVKNAVSKDLVTFIYNYFLIRRQVARTLFESKYISPIETIFGTWNDTMVANTYSCYADNVMETLLLKLQPIMEKETGLKLNPNYSYARIYKKGDILKRHKDRFSCEISTTMHLGGDCWPIYLEPDESKGAVDLKKGVYVPANSKGVKVMLKPGDLLIYRGDLLEHWRKPFQGKDCAQVFLHYNNLKTPGAKKNIFDGRKHIGLPPVEKLNDY